METDSTDRETLRERLYEVMDEDELLLSEKRQRALEIGQAFLGADCARIQRSEGANGTKEIVATAGEVTAPLESSTDGDPPAVDCQWTTRSESTVAFADAEAEGWTDHPDYRNCGLSAYIGTPIPVHDRVYGAICFNDVDPRDEPFTTTEKLFVELIARLLGHELETSRYERTIDETGQAREFSERKYQTLLETAPNAILLADASTGEIIGSNEEAAGLTGYSREALEGMAVFDIHPSEDREKYVELFSETPEGVTRSRFDDGSHLYVRRADGEDVPVEISASLVELSPDRKVVQGILRDVSERQRRERELERNQEFLQQAQEAVGLGAWEMDVTAAELRCTDQIYRIYGLPLDHDLTFDEALSYIHPADRDQVSDAYERLVVSAESFDVEARIRTADGEVRWVRVVGGPVYDDDSDDIVAFRGVTMDITERRGREADLHLKNRAIAEASVGIFITDATTTDRRLVYANDEFERLTGYEETQLRDQPCAVLAGSATDDSIADEIDEALASGESRSGQLLHERADGTPFWTELSVTPVESDDGRITHCVGFLRDITLRKRREGLVGVLNRVLRHNLRNDMNVVCGYAKTIAEEESGRVADLADRIATTAGSLIALSEKARTLEDSMGNPDTLAARDVVADVHATVKRLRSNHPAARVIVDAPETCRAVATDQFRRALYELGENAAKHDGEPKVTISVERVDDGRVVVEVSDSGPGLPKNEREVLETGRETPLGHGQGLGLWLVNWIVTGIGGELSVDVDDGTTVSIALHAGDDLEEATPAEQYRQAALGTRSP